MFTHFVSDDSTYNLHSHRANPGGVEGLPPQ